MNEPHPTPAPLQVTTLSADDLEDILDIDAAAFGQDAPQDFLDVAIIPWLELDRFVGARDPAAGNELVAAGCIFSKQMTFPGGLVQPAAGVSWIGVRPGWRRRGLLRGLMTAQLHGLHDGGGEAVAILTASEAGLYGRFGYGQSINRHLFQVAHGAAFHSGVGTDNVIEIRADRAPDIVKPLYAKVAATRHGYLARTDEVWAMRFSDHELLRDGASKKRWAVHPDGYAAYRVKSAWTERGPNFSLQVDEICAATDRAFASLWRYLLDFDLTRQVNYDKGWIDDPLLDLLHDPRSVTVNTRDHIWLRIVDLDSGDRTAHLQLPGARGGRADGRILPMEPGHLDVRPGRRRRDGLQDGRVAAGASGHQGSRRLLRRRNAAGPAGDGAAGDRRAGRPAGTRCGTGHPTRTVVSGGLLSLRRWRPEPDPAAPGA